MTFIAATLNHFRAVQAWAAANGADVRLNVLNFEMEVKARHRYFTLKPLFLANTQGRLAHVSMLTQDTTGLIGWFPYAPPLRLELGRDKLAFKSWIAKAGFRTPACWEEPVGADADCIVKPSRGSFGYGLRGPYRVGAAAAALPAEQGGAPLFAEQFVQGHNVKMWFWGETPFFAHVHAYPAVEGDGMAPLRKLVQQRLDRVGRVLDDSAETAVIAQSLAYQGFTLDHVLAEGTGAWLDYRYGRTFAASPVTSRSDNALATLSSRAGEQAIAFGRFLAAEINKTLPVPVLYSVDAVLDAQDDLWWLEMNSNPILPPDGYPLILSTLFGDGGSA